MERKAGKLKGGQTMLNGAMILVVATIIVKVIGAVYKIPLTALIGEVGRGYFSSAYELYTPVYAISMAGLPVAVSKMVSESVTVGRYRDAKMIFRLSFRLFLIVGVIGTVLLLIIAVPYVLLAHSKANIWSILMIAPSIFFCSLMSTYRGYYEGLRNMIPTAVSQVIEALGKLVFGIYLAKVTMSYGMDRFASGQKVFGKLCTDEAAALSAIYPFAAAAAVMGVTIGTMAGLLYTMIRHRFIGDHITQQMLAASPQPEKSNVLLKTMITIAIPMVLSALIMNVTNIVDNFTIRTRLAHAVFNNLDYFKTRFSDALIGSNTVDDDIHNYLYGCYFSALDLKNLVSSITMSLGVSAIPALAAAKAARNKKEVSSTINSVVRMCMMIAAPAGFGMAVLAEPLMTLLYGSTRPYLVPIAAPIVCVYGWATFIMAITTPLTNVLQALGRPDIPAKVIAVGVVIKVIFNFIFVGMPKLNIYGATIGTVLCYLVIVVLSVYYTVKVSRCRIDVISTCLKPIGCSLVSAVIAFAVHALFSKILTFGSAESMLNGGNVATLLAVMAAAVAYAAGMLLIKGIVYDDVIMLPKGEKIAKLLAKRGFLG